MRPFLSRRAPPAPTSSRRESVEGALPRVSFSGWVLGALYTLFQNDNLLALFPSQPDYQPDLGPQHLLKGAAIRADVTPEYLGVGYIIGPRVAGVIFAGGVFSWLGVMPLIYFFGSHIPDAIYP